MCETVLSFQPPVIDNSTGEKVFFATRVRLVGSPPKHFGDWCSQTSGSNSSPTRRSRVGDEF